MINQPAFPERGEYERPRWTGSEVSMNSESAFRNTRPQKFISLALTPHPASSRQSPMGAEK